MLLLHGVPRNTYVLYACHIIIMNWQVANISNHKNSVESIYILPCLLRRLLWLIVGFAVCFGLYINPVEYLCLIMDYVIITGSMISRSHNQALQA